MLITIVIFCQQFFVAEKEMVGSEKDENFQ
jgi:hypothetical protein